MNELSEEAIIEFHLPFVIRPQGGGEDHLATLTGQGKLSQADGEWIVRPMEDRRFPLWAIPSWGPSRMEKLEGCDPPVFLLSVGEIYYTGEYGTDQLPILDCEEPPEQLIERNSMLPELGEPIPLGPPAVREIRERWEEWVRDQYR